MKRFFFYFMLGFVLATLPHFLFGQISGSVKLNVVINQVQSLTINEAQSQVDLLFSQKEDFKKGVHITEPAHLNVFSSGRFVVKVSTLDDLRGVGNKKIPAATIAVQPTATGGTVHVPDMTTDRVNLSREARAIIKSPTHGTIATSFDVLYHASGEDYAMLSNGVYSGTVVYTIEAD